jgi:hypothetical protein
VSQKALEAGTIPGELDRTLGQWLQAHRLLLFPTGSPGTHTEEHVTNTSALDPDPDPGSQTNADPCGVSDPGQTLLLQNVELIHEKCTYLKLNREAKGRVCPCFLELY